MLTPGEESEFSVRNRTRRAEDGDKRADIEFVAGAYEASTPRHLQPGRVRSPRATILR